MKTIRLAALAAALILITLAQAWAKGPADFSKGGLTDRDAVLAAAKEATREKYPDADMVALDQHMWIKYATDGSFVQWDESWMKVLTEKGRRDLSVYSSYFTIPYNTTRFTLLEIIRPDGTVTPVDVEANSRETVQSGQMSSNIYNPNDKLLQVSIPDLGVGDIVHCVIMDDFARVRMPNAWSDYILFEGTNPLVRKEYTVVAPKEMPLESIAVKGEIGDGLSHEVKEQGDEIVYTWVATNVPRVFEEPDMPEFHTVGQRLLISTLKSWEQVSSWYWELCKPHLDKTTPAMQAKVKELTKGLSDRHDKIKALFYWVSKEVRYLGLTVESDSPGYEPHDVNLTFERKAGVCRDKAALLAAMLRLADIEAFPVLIMNGPKKDPETPQPSFNHAITAVREPDGTYLLMDATDENTRELFPAYLNNQSYLVATPEGDTLRTSPVEAAEDNLMKVAVTGKLDEKGRLTAQAEFVFDGINDNAYRSYFANVLPEEREEHFERMIKNIAPGATLTSLEILPENMADITQTLTVRLGFETGDLRLEGQDVVMLPVFRLGREVGIARFLLGKMGLEKRRFPVVTEYACGVQETLELDLGRAVGRLLSPPQYKALETDGVTWKREATVENGVLKAKSLFLLKKPEYSPAEYATLQDVMAAMESDDEKMAVFYRAAPGPDEEWYAGMEADAVVLDDELDYVIEDAHAWTETHKTRIKILTYAGKKAFSEINLDYNPVWEEVKIVSARVVGADGKATEVLEQELVTMDMDWVGEAPRYPAGKTLVVGLPAVEIGSIVEVELEHRKWDRPFFSVDGPSLCQDPWGAGDSVYPPGLFSLAGGFRGLNPVLKKTLRIDAPKDLEPDVLASSFGYGIHPKPGEEKVDIAHTRTEEKGRVVHAFTATRVAPVKDQGFMPPWFAFNPMVFASSGDWTAYAQSVRQALVQAAEKADTAGAKAKELTKGLESERDKLKAIRDHVALSLRIVGPSLDMLPLSAITPADQTLADGYGNRADSAVLLYAMLEAAGFEPEFVLASRASRLEALRGPLHDYPEPRFFGMVMVRVNTDQGFVYLNDTDQYAELGTTYHHGWPGLVLPSGELFVITAQDLEHQELEHMDHRIRLEANGDAWLTVTRRYYGTNYQIMRKYMAEISPEERRRRLRDLAAAYSQTAEPVGRYETDFDAYPGVERYTMRITGYAVRQGPYLYLPLDGLTGRIAGAERDERDTPLYRPWQSRQDISVEVWLPEETDAILAAPPEELVLEIPDSGVITLSAKAEQDRGQTVFRVRERTDLKPVVLDPDDYDDLLEMDRQLARQGTRTLLLKMKK